MLGINHISDGIKKAFTASVCGAFWLVTKGLILCHMIAYDYICNSQIVTLNGLQTNLFFDHYEGFMNHNEVWLIVDKSPTAKSE